MNTIGNGFLKALSLIADFNSELFEIVFLSLKVSGAALLAATLIGLGAGVFLSVKKFPGRHLVITILNTLMGLPPVVVGLVVYLFLSRSGPLGFWGLLYSPSAMIIAQSILATPIVAVLTISAISGVSLSVRETAISLGATPPQTFRVIMYDARFSLLAAVIAGLGRIIAEVGAVMMVGGNIAGYTRVMTTAIAMDTSKGEFELAIALGIILILTSFVINLCLSLIQGRFKSLPDYR